MYMVMSVTEAVNSFKPIVRDYNLNKIVCSEPHYLEMLL
jgi:hypothetical protein